MRISDLSFRQISGTGALVSAGLLAFGYYLQYFEGQDPCPLCLLQRGFYYGVLVVLAAGALHGPARGGAAAHAIRPGPGRRAGSVLQEGEPAARAHAAAAAARLRAVRGSALAFSRAV